MKFVKQVGNINAYTEQNADNSITVIFCNGSDKVMVEIYFNAKGEEAEENAIDDLFRKRDTYTDTWLSIHVPDLQKLSDNTYTDGDKDWFCRIDETKYFKHFFKNGADFVTDKAGLRIIDK